MRQTGSTAGPVPFANQWSSADLALHPIVQERLTNTLKHAHASRVEVDIRQIDDAVEVALAAWVAARARRAWLDGMR